MVDGRIRIHFRKEGVVIECPIINPIEVEERWHNVGSYTYDEISRKNLNLHIKSVNPIFKNGTLTEIVLEGNVPPLQHDSFQQVRRLHHSRKVISSTNPDELLIKLAPAFRSYPLIPIPREYREKFPGYKVPFTLETDVGEVQTYITSAPEGTKIGDPYAGNYIRAGITKWASAHPELDGGDWVKITIIEPKKRYRLDPIK
jgi:hypothetical protein